MAMNNGNNKLHIVIFFTIIIVIILAFFFLMKESKGNVKEHLLDYSQEFFDSSQSMCGGDSIQLLLVTSMKENVDNDSLFYGNLRYLSRNMFEKGDQSKAIGFLTNVISIFRNSECDSSAKEYLAYCHLLLGAANDEVGLTSISHEYYFNGLKILDAIKKDKLRGDFYNNLGVSLYRTGQSSKARAYFDSAMNCAVATDNPRLISIVHTNLAELYSEQGQYDKSIDHLLKSIHITYSDSPARPDEKSEDYYSLQSALGSLYLKNNNLPMAYACLSNAYNHMDKAKNKSYIYTTAYLMASYFNTISLNDSVKKYMDIAWRTADAENNPYHRMLLYEKEMNMAADNGNFKGAFSLARQILTLKDSLHNQENLHNIEESQNIYNLEKEAMSRRSGISEWNPSTVFVIMSLLLIVVCGIVIFLVVRIHKIRKLRDDALEVIVKEAELNKKEAENSKKVAEDEKLNSEATKEELRHLNQRLSSFALERLMINPRIEEISTELKRTISKLSSRDKDEREFLTAILTKLTLLQSDAKWDDFQHYFENVHPDFYSRLDEMHPNLTAKDRRLCALISLGMSTKDIASVVCLEVRSVESSRNRLRKKLGLDNDCNLFEYIKSL